MNVFADVWNAQRPVRQILADEYPGEIQAASMITLNVGELNKEHDTI